MHIKEICNDLKHVISKLDSARMIVSLSLLLLVSSTLQEGTANSTDECSLLQDIDSCVRDENHVTNLLQLTLLKQIINQSPQATKLDQLESLLQTIIKSLMMTPIN